MRVFAFLLCFTVYVESLLAQKLKDFPEVHINYTALPVKIDGAADEEAWKAAEVTADFCRTFPDDTGFARTHTEVKMIYDSRNIYVFAHCQDTIKKDYVIQSLKRDFSYPVSDAFTVIFDPFDDKTNGYSFGVNPYGVQREGLIAGGGSSGVSTDWDNTWYAEVQRHDTFWTAEMAIPFKSIRFKPGNIYWGVNFTRNDLKRNESSTWSPVPRVFNIATLAFTGKLHWDEPLKKYGPNFSLIPYLTGQAASVYGNDATTTYKPNGGLDTKIGLGSSLNIDLTVNPDFSQVEVDRQVTNLTRFSLFFPERRNFFIENSDLFANFGFRQIRPFFSRRIGLDAGGNLIPIYGGFRLSGKPNQKWRIGAMSMQSKSNRERGIPNENFLVAAFQRLVFKRSFISGILINRQTLPDSSNISGQNAIAGIDYNLASENNAWIGKFFFHYNLTQAKPDKSFSHASFLLYNTRRVFAMWNHEYVGKNYNPTMGFVPRNVQFDLASRKQVRNSYWRLEPEFVYTFYPKSKLINNHGPGMYVDAYYNDTLINTDRLIRGLYAITFQSSAVCTLQVNNNYVNLFYMTDITGKSDTLTTGRYNFSDITLSYTTNKRRKVFALMNGVYGQFYNATRRSFSVELSGRIQPVAILSVNASYDRLFFGEKNKTSELLLIGPKFEFAFTRSIFFTTFIQYNTQTERLNINARFQYRFKPMSDFYLVYTDNYNSTNISVISRAIVFKCVYWFNI